MFKPETCWQLLSSILPRYIAENNEGGVADG